MELNCPPGHGTTALIVGGRELDNNALQQTAVCKETTCGHARFSCLLSRSTPFCKGVAVSVVNSAIQLLFSGQGHCVTTPARPTTTSSSPRPPNTKDSTLTRALLHRSRQRSQTRKISSPTSWTVRSGRQFLPRKDRTPASTSGATDNDEMTLSVMISTWSDGRNCKILIFIPYVLSLLDATNKELQDTTGRKTLLPRMDQHALPRGENLPVEPPSFQTR